MYRINEIFYSLQGEGYHTGRAAVFIRFSGCNLRCPFCDTDFMTYKEMSAAEIVAEAVRLFPDAAHRFCVLTGGEPTLQVDEELVRQLHAERFYIAIETNGTHPVLPQIEWVTCSPKQGGHVVLDYASEVKVVYVNDNDRRVAGDENENVEIWRDRIAADYYYLQPCSCQNTETVVSYIFRHPWWKLSLQTHKIINIQ